MLIHGLIYFLIFVTIAFTFLKKGTDFFSPARLFVLVWTFSIGLTELKFSRFQFEWSSYSWIVLMIALFSTLLGMFSIYVIYVHNNIYKISSIREQFTKVELDSSLLFKSIVVLSICYLISLPHLFRTWLLNFKTISLLFGSFVLLIILLKLVTVNFIIGIPILFAIYFFIALFYYFSEEERNVIFSLDFVSNYFVKKKWNNR